MIVVVKIGTSSITDSHGEVDAVAVERLVHRGGRAARASITASSS